MIAHRFAECTLAICCAVALPTVGHASNESEARVQLLLSLRGIPDVFNAVASLEFESTRVIELGPGAQAPEKGYRIGSLRWKSKGPLFNYEVTPVRRMEENDTNIFAFDGHYAQQLEPKERTLTLTKRNFVSIPGTLADDMVLPFAFLPKEARKTPTFTDPRLSIIADKERWEELIREISYTGRVHTEGEAYEIFEVPGPRYVTETTYRVYFSLSTQFPMKWELVNDKKQVLSQYIIDRLGEIRLDNDNLFKYPAVAHRQSFGMGSTESPIQEQPLSTVTITIENVRVNDAIADESFTIDPSRAESIFDLDSDTVIAVPH